MESWATSASAWGRVRDSPALAPTAFLAEKYCVPNQCTDNRRHPAECGGHGECKLKSLAEFTCVCNANYETVDTDELGLHYCVAQACMVKDNGVVTSICNGHGLCRKDRCSCYEGYADDPSASTNDPTGNCTVCATGYKEYPAPNTLTAIAANANCVKITAAGRLKTMTAAGPLLPIIPPVCTRLRLRPMSALARQATTLTMEFVRSPAVRTATPL